MGELDSETDTSGRSVLICCLINAIKVSTAFKYPLQNCISNLKMKIILIIIQCLKRIFEIDLQLKRKKYFAVNIHIY